MMNKRIMQTVVLNASVQLEEIFTNNYKTIGTGSFGHHGKLYYK